MTITLNGTTGITTTGLTSTGIDDNATSTAITISSGNDVGFGRSPTAQAGFTILDVGTATTSGLIDLRQNGTRQTRIYNSSSDTYFRNAGGDIYLQPDEATAMALKDGGNVGIGTTSPAKLLETVATNSGADTTNLQVRNNATAASTSSSIRFVNSTSATSTAGGSELSSIRTASDGGDLAFKVAADSTATLTERMRIDSSGRVGIGTSSPSRLLSVKGTVAFEATNSTNAWSAYAYTDNSFRLNLNGAGADELVIDSSGNVIAGGTSAQAADAVTLMSDGEVTAAGFYFSNNIGSAMNDTGIRRATTSTMVFDTGSTERMRIDGSGNVGINTTSPQEKFHVASDDGRIAVQSSNGNTIDAIMGGYVIYSGDGSGPGAGNRAGIQSFIRDSFGVKYDLRFYTSDGSTNFNEVGRFTEDGNLLVGATSATGHFTNGLPTATLSTGSTGGTAFSRTHRASSSNNATVDAFRFFDANGNLNNGYINGHLYVQVNGGSGLHSSQRMYYIQTNSNGTLNSNFTLLSTATRGTDPVSSIAMVADGAGGAVKIQITYINNSSVVNSGSSTISFIGQA